MVLNYLRRGGRLTASHSDESMKSRKGLRVAIPIAPLSLLQPARGGNATRIGVEEVNTQREFEP